MGHLYRFVEPVLLLMLKERGRSYGYDLSADLSRYAFTDAEIERAVLYRTLRRLEENGYVTSDWDVEEPGPARRVYSLTREGKRHLREWADVLTGCLTQAAFAWVEWSCLIRPRSPLSPESYSPIRWLPRSGRVSCFRSARPVPSPVS